MSSKPTMVHPPAGAIPPAEPTVLAEMVDYGEAAVVSRTLTRGASGTLTVFAFDKGQELSEHTAPFDAYVVVLKGEATLTIDGKAAQAGAGQIVLMPANIPHAVTANERFKMLLIMLKKG